MYSARQPKYRTHRDETGGYLINNADGDTVAVIDHPASLQWAVKELNTLNWAIEVLLERIERYEQTTAPERTG